MESQGYGHNSSPGELASSKKDRNGRTGILHVMPCTVSQLLSAREHRDSFYIRDMQLNQVAVVGLIRRTKQLFTHVVYCLDDMTSSPLDVKQWQTLEDVNMNHSGIPPGKYVKVVGSLRMDQHHRSMVAFKIRQLDDYNEITSHMLEVIRAHLFYDGSLYSMMNKTVTSQIINTSCPSDPATSDFTANQRQIFMLIKSCRLAEGISLQYLSNSLKRLSFYDIRNCLQYLINEGHIFSTVDDFHFKCTTG